mgnify:FL=1
MSSIEAALAAATATAERFVALVAEGNEDGVRALCTEAGWEGGDTRVYGLVRQAQRKGLVLDLFGEPRKLANRAAQLVVLSHPARPRPLGDLWLLLEDAGEGWLVVGATKLREHAGLFLWKALGGTLALADLDPSPRGDAFAANVLASLQEGVVPELPFGSELLSERLQAEGVSVKALRSVELLPVSRAAVGFGFTTPDDSLGYDVWLILSLSSREPTVVGATEFLGLEPLFKAVEVDWPHEDPDRPGHAIPGYEDPTDPEGGRVVLEGILRSILVASGADPSGLPEDDPRRKAIGELFAGIRRMAPREGEDPHDTSLDAMVEAMQPNPDAPMPLQLPPEVQERVALALESIEARTPDGPAGDEARSEEAVAFVQTQGAELVSGIFQAFFEGINPQGVKLTTLEQRVGEDGQPELRAIVDPAELLGDISGGFDEE